jgi:ribosomal protein S12 methylthiotransferase
MPDIAIRTTFIVGFPGEDAAAFANLRSFVERSRFDRMGVFEFSPEENTPAGVMRPSVPARISGQRRRALMALQQPISLAINQAFIGRDLSVLIEGRREDHFVARSYRDAPEIDGSVFVSGTNDLKVGSWQRVRVTAAEPYDLRATII